MTRSYSVARAGLTVLTVLAASACGKSPTSPTPPTQPPSLTITCPADVEVVSQDGQATSVTYPDPTVQGATSTVGISCSPPSGSAFAVGATIVTCTAAAAGSALAGCTFAVRVRVPPPRLLSTRFLAFGNSLTEGVTSNPYVPLMLGPAESYPTRLAALLAERYQGQAITVVNAGLSGECASDGVGRLPGVLSQHAPEVLLLLEGANDLNTWAWWGNGVARAATALDEMVVEAKHRNIRVFLATLPPWRDGGPKFLDASLVPPVNDQIRRIAADRGAVLVDLYAAFEPDMDKLIGADGLHPTEDGYQRMAERFMEAIVRTLEVRGGQ